MVDAFSVDAPKTKQLTEKLKVLGIESALIVTESDDINLYLAARNIYNVDVIDASGVNPVDLIKFENVVMTVDSVKRIEEMLA